MPHAGIRVRGRKSTPGRYFQVANPGLGWGGTDISDPLSVIHAIDPATAWPGLRLLMTSTTGEDALYCVLDEALKPVPAEMPEAVRRVVERIGENCEPSLCTVLFMAGAGGSLRAGVTDNPVLLTRSVAARETRVTMGGAPVYVWPGGGITVMVDVERMPKGSFGYVPTPALVAPIEFTLPRALYERLGGHAGEHRVGLRHARRRRGGGARGRLVLRQSLAVRAAAEDAVSQVSQSAYAATSTLSPLRGEGRGGGNAGRRSLTRPLPRSEAAPPQGGRGRAALDYRLEDQVGFVLRRAHQRASGIFNAVMGEFGVTPTQFAALAKLHDLGAVSQNELGRLTAMDPATIWGVVGRLIKRGYVAQSVDANDARLVILELTEAGRAATLAMKEVAAEVSQRTLEPLSEAEAATFLALLQRLG